MTDWLKELLAMAEATPEEEERRGMPEVLPFPVMGALRGAAAHRPEAETGGPAAAQSADSGMVSDPGRNAQAGGASALRTLYRQAGEAVRSGVGAAGPGTQRVVVREQTGSPAGLTAAELDRAVRRDSRRYDGGMSIY